MDVKGGHSDVNMLKVREDWGRVQANRWLLRAGIIFEDND